MDEDNVFDSVLEVLKEIHVLKPDLCFGMVLQTSVDRFKLGKNVDFHNLSSKQLLSALKNFKNDINNGGI